MVQTEGLRSGSTVEALTTSSLSSLASRDPLMATRAVQVPLVVGLGSLKTFSRLTGPLQEKPLMLLHRGKLLQ